METTTKERSLRRGVRFVPVADDPIDAPDGAVLEIDGERWERVGDEWVVTPLQ